MTTFKQGDIVRLINGHSPILVVNTWGNRPDQLAGVYVSSMGTVKRRAMDDFVLWHEGDGQDETPDNYMLDHLYRIAISYVRVRGHDHTYFTGENVEAAAGTAYHRLNHAERDNEIADEIINHNKGETDMTEKLYQTKEDTPRYGTKLAVNRDGLIVLDMRGGAPEAFKKDDIEEVVPYTVEIAGYTSSTITHFQVREGMLSKGDVVVKGTALFLVTDVDTKDRDAKPIGKVHIIPTKTVEFNGDE